MRQILFLSGKGGTGKTTLAAAFAVLAKDTVLADCDVDAANLHLLLSPEIQETGAFQGSKEAVRDATLCTACGRCQSVCRFAAVSKTYKIDPYLCEGCGACVTACPAQAIALDDRVSGYWFHASTRWGPLASAELLPGEETSGKLVSHVKHSLESLAKPLDVEWAIVDGSPGIGCPVIASASGVDCVLLITEPTQSGLHDLERILGVVNHFGLPAYLVINKADLCLELAGKLEEYAAREMLPVLGRIPYDASVARCMTAGTSVVLESRSPAGTSIREIYNRFMEVSRDC